MALYSYTPLTFQIHIIKNLILKVPIRDATGMLKKPVGQSALTVIDMSYYAKVSGPIHKLQK